MIESQVLEFLREAGSYGLSPIMAMLAYVMAKGIGEFKKLRMDLVDIAHALDKRVSMLEWHIEKRGVKTWQQSEKSG